MDQSLLQFTITAFVMLIVVINPVAVAPVFVAVTNGMAAGERRSVLNRALLIAFGVALFFLLAGRVMLSYLGVTMHAFAVSGECFSSLSRCRCSSDSVPLYNPLKAASAAPTTKMLLYSRWLFPCSRGQALLPRCWCWQLKPQVMYGVWRRWRLR